MNASSFSLAAFTLASALVAAGCASDTESGTDLADAAPDADVADAGTSAQAQPEAGTIRVVNLWPNEGEGASVDVYLAPLLGNETAMFTALPYGSVSATAGVPAEADLRVYSAGDPGAGEGYGSPALVATENLRADLEEAQRLTVVVTYFTPLREGKLGGSVRVFKDTGDKVSGGMPVQPVDGGLLVADVTPVVRILGDAAEPLTFGVPGQGCLRPAGASAGTMAGGTAVMLFDVPPGVSRIAAYPTSDGKCSGPPRIGPVDVNVAAAGRTYLFAYGSGPDDLELLAVPSGG